MKKLTKKSFDPIDQEENVSHQTMEKPSKNLERILYQ